MSQERLQKILARAGVASRRAAEGLISAGRVKVDGRTIRTLGTQADPEQQRIEVDGRRVGSEPLQYLVLHKPREVVSTLNDPVKRHTVMELIAGAGARVVPLGRLDYHTSGVLLFSNDGEFSRTLLHPSSGVPRQYVLKVKGPVEEARLERLRDRIVIDGRRTQPAEVVRERNEGDKVWLLITLKEGRNRHVRRLAEHAGFQVMRLARLSFANITAEGLAPGQWRSLTRDELKELQRLYGVPKELPAGGGGPEGERVEGVPVRMRTRVAQAERAKRPAEARDVLEAGESPEDEPRRGAARPPGAKKRGSTKGAREQSWSGSSRVAKPRAQQPRTQQPRTQQPRAQQPRAQQPRTQQPRTQQPRAQQPRAQRPRTGVGPQSGDKPWVKPQRATAAPYAKKRRAAHDSSEQAWSRPAGAGARPVRKAKATNARRSRTVDGARSSARAASTSAPRRKKR